LPASDLNLLLSAAQDAGEVALSFWRRDPRTWHKDDASPVTEADLAVNDRLAATLRAARPDYGWLSEETPDDAGDPGGRLQRDRTFIIDPIDGTRAFVAGEDDFALALAVAEAGRVTAAVVHLPACGQTYAATCDGPATLNGLPLRVRPAPATPVVMAGRPSVAPAHWPGGLPVIERRFRAAMQVRLCHLAEGRADAVLALNAVAEWDSGAGALIAARAGAIATDGDGYPLRFNQADVFGPGLIVAGPALHADLIARRKG
jgi:myo-inositol-1(or 4)-monophosphatase